MITATGALIYSIRTNRYLFLLRNGTRYYNTWGLPGGKIEPGETVEQALMREIEEELGGIIRGCELVPIETFVSDNSYFTFHTFLIAVEDEFIPELNIEHKGYCWTHITDHPRPLHPGVWRTISFDTVIKKLIDVKRVIAEHQDGVYKSG